MPTRAALTPALLEEQIQQRIAHPTLQLEPVNESREVGEPCQAVPSTSREVVVEQEQREERRHSLQKHSQQKSDQDQAGIPTMTSSDSLNKMSAQISNDIIDQVCREHEHETTAKIRRQTRESSLNKGSIKETIMPSSSGSLHQNSRSNSLRPSKTPSTDLPMSLKNLQEMVSTLTY